MVTTPGFAPSPSYPLGVNSEETTRGRGTPAAPDDELDDEEVLYEDDELEVPPDDEVLEVPLEDDDQDELELVPLELQPEEADDDDEPEEVVPPSVSGSGA